MRMDSRVVAVLDDADVLSWATLGPFPVGRMAEVGEYHTARAASHAHLCLELLQHDADEVEILPRTRLH